MTDSTPIIVKSDTVHIFKGRTWDANSFAVAGVYAIGFPNGVVKFGRSKNIRQRLKSYDLTGHANSVDFYLLRKHPSPNVAEKALLTEAGAAFKRAGAPECFYCDEHEAVKIMSGYLGEAKPEMQPTKLSEFHATIHMKDGRVIPLDQYKAELFDIPVVHLVLAFERYMVIDGLADAVFEIMDERQLIVFKAVAMKNAVLLGRGMAYEDRKKILEAFALENRSMKPDGLSALAAATRSAKTP